MGYNIKSGHGATSESINITRQIQKIKNTGTCRFMQQLCFKEKSQRVKSHKLNITVPAPLTFVLHHLQYSTSPSPASFNQLTRNLHCFKRAYNVEYLYSGMGICYAQATGLLSGHQKLICQINDHQGVKKLIEE
jgi:hypothetical protein